VHQLDGKRTSIQLSMVWTHRLGGVLLTLGLLADTVSATFPPSSYYHSGDLYFQYYGALYHMPTGFRAGDWTTAARTKVVVTWPDNSTNSGYFDSGYVQYCGPVVDEGNPNILYIIGKQVPISSSYHIIQVNVTNGPSQATGKVLHTLSYSYGNRDAAMGWDPYAERLFWCRGDSVGSSSYYGKCFTFKPGVDTEPQDWGSSGIGSYTLVGSGVRGPATVQMSGGTKYVYFAGKKGVWRQEVGASDTLDGTNLVKLVDQDVHEVFGGADDVDQFGYGLKYVNETDELFYVSVNRGTFRIPNPKDAPSDGVGLPLWTFQGHSDHCGMAFDPNHHEIYGTAKALVGSAPDCSNAGLQWFRVDTGWASDANRSGELHQPQVVEQINNCDLSNSGNSDCLGLSWMAIAGTPTSASSAEPVPREVNRKDTVTANGLVDSEMYGVVFHVTEIKTGVYEYIWTDVANQVSQTIFICDDGGGGARSSMAYDNEYGWLYVICQQRLLRIDPAGLINAGYGVEGSNLTAATVDVYGGITPTPHEGGLIEVLHDTMYNASSDQGTGQVPQSGWHGYTEHFVYGAGLSLVDGVLYFTTRQYKATTYPTFDLGLWAWRLGQDTGWIPVALIPGTPGANQAGVVKGDGSGNLYLSIGNQVDDDVNGLWMIYRPFDMFGDMEVRQVLTVTGPLANTESQVYGYELEVDSVSGLPKAVYMSTKNESYTSYSSDLSTLSRVPWVGNATDGSFDENQASPMDDIYHRGHCTFGCAVWTLLGINIDPTTGVFWLNYYNGDGDQFIASYSPETGKVNDGCYFYAASASVTFPKFSVLLEFGASESSQCPCLSKNGVPTSEVPGSTAIGYCSRTFWMTPISPGADDLGRCNVDECLSCDPDTSPGSCDGFLEKCSISCCNMGYGDGTWEFVGWGGAADYFRAQEQCTGDATHVTSTESTTTTTGTTTGTATGTTSAQTTQSTTTAPVIGSAHIAEAASSVFALCALVLLLPT